MREGLRNRERSLLRNVMEQVKKHHINSIIKRIDMCGKSNTNCAFLSNWDQNMQKACSLKIF